MGRPKLEKPTNSAERMRKYRSDPVKKEKENTKQRSKRNETELTEEQFEKSCPRKKRKIKEECNTAKEDGKANQAA